MKVKFLLILAVCALFVMCKSPNSGIPGTTDSPDVFTVTFNKNHQDASGYAEANPRTKTVTTPATTVGSLPAQPTRANYTFTGWNTNPNGSGAAFTAATTVTANITVYAQWQPSAVVVIPAIVDFETSITVGFTQGDNSPTVTVVADPVNSGQKSLQIATNGGNNQTYNQAATVPINLPYALQNYKSFTFRFRLTSGSLTNQQVLLYAASNTDTFVRYGFGNPADHSNPNQQFAANLVGSVTPDYSKTNQWQSLTITITNPGEAIKNLQGNIFLAIGINLNGNVTYLFDDLTFTVKDGFVPPAPPPGPELPSTGAVSSGTYRNLFKEFGKTDAEITAKVNAAWNQLFVNGTANQKIYIEVGNDMAYIFDSGNNDVRSEGMSYGMMMAVQMNDQTRFNKLWKWAKTYMYHNRLTAAQERRGFFAWQCETNGNKKDQNCAPDGEFYFATALLFASARWGDGSDIFEYGREARKLLYDMINRPAAENSTPPMFRKTNYNEKGQYMPVFQPYGNNYNFTDPSYHLPAFYDIWAIEIENGASYHDIWGSSAAAMADAQFYRNAAQASRAFFPTTVNPTTGLGPDYAEFSGAGTGGNHADFEYDAWRIAMNIAVDYAWWAKDPWQITQSNRIQSFFHSKGVESYGNRWTLNGNLKNDSNDHSPGLVACNAVASLAASQALTWDFIENFWNISTTTGQYRYYDGCLYMMGLLHVTGNFKAYLSPGSSVTPNSTISPTTASFDKKQGAQADITVTMTLNGNTLSNIKNGSATLVQGTNYTVSGSTVTIKAAYLAQQPNGAATLTFNFSAGSARTLIIIIGDTTGGGPIGGTVLEYTFDTNVNAAFAPSGSTSTAVRKVNNGANVLEVAIQAKDDVVILPFNLGSTTLANYASLYVEVAAISGDATFKSFVAQVSLTGTFGKGDSANNTTIARQDGNALGANNSWGTYTIPLQNKNSPVLTGPVNIAFWLPNANSGAVYQIRVLRLIP